MSTEESDNQDPMSPTLPPDVYCPQCGYCLHGTASDQCPECGYGLARMRSADARITWELRRERGRIKTYWQTVWMVTFKNRQFCEAYAHPISYSDARRFQWITILHAYIPILIASVLFYTGREPTSNAPTPMLPWAILGASPPPTILGRAYDEGWPIALLLLCFIPFLFAATGVYSYFFHPKSICIERQNAGIALSHYICAPLALAPVVMSIGLGVLAMADSGRWFKVLPLLLIGMTVLIVTLLWWVTLFKTARRVMPQLRRRAATIAVAVPVLWLLLAILVLGVMPLAAAFVIVVLVSLT